MLYRRRSVNGALQTCALLTASPVDLAARADDVDDTRYRRTNDDNTSTKNEPMFVTRTTTADSVDVERSHTESGYVGNRSYRQQESSYVLRVDLSLIHI